MMRGIRPLLPRRFLVPVIARSTSDEAIQTLFLAAGLLRLARNNGGYATALSVYIASISLA
jgi:hypothetical protein